MKEARLQKEKAISFTACLHAHDVAEFQIIPNTQRYRIKECLPEVEGQWRNVQLCKDHKQKGLLMDRLDDTVVFL